MKSFTSLQHLLRTMQREEGLLTELFQKRNSLDYRCDYADAGKITSAQSL